MKNSLRFVIEIYTKYNNNGYYDIGVFCSGKPMFFHMIMKKLYQLKQNKNKIIMIMEFIYRAIEIKTNYFDRYYQILSEMKLYYI